MADPPISGSDLIGGVQYAIVKIAFGARGEIIDAEFPTPFPVRQSDGTTAANIDPVHGAPLFIDIIHHEVHEGKAFSTGHIFEDVGSDANADILIQVGANKELHIIFAAAVGAQAFLNIYEGTTFSAAGTALAITDHNRIIDNTSDATATHTPTVTAAGTLLLPSYIPGAGNLAQGGGTAAIGRNEWDLAKSTNYLFRVTNKGVGTAHISQNLSWYEES